MVAKSRHLSLGRRTVYRRIEDVVGCKWSTSVIAAVAEGVHRPGEMERFIPGISKKILNERLRKLVAFGLLERSEFPGTVPHVEYHLTQAGKKLRAILSQLHEIEGSLAPQEE